MSLANNPFSSWGRLDQKRYWLIAGLILALRIGMGVAIAFRPEWASSAGSLDFLILLLAIAIGKRMKDFGVSPWWAWLSVLLISVVLPIAGLIVEKRDAGAAAAPSGLIGLLTFALLMALVVFAGVKKGDPGPNRFGEAPV